MGKQITYSQWKWDGESKGAYGRLFMTVEFFCKVLLLDRQSSEKSLCLYLLIPKCLCLQLKIIFMPQWCVLDPFISPV